MKKIRVAILDNPIYSPLVQNIDKVAEEFSYEVFKLNEPQITKFILENKFDLMLVNPYILARTFKFADLRIVPTRIIASVSYTNQASINFKGNLRTISELFVSNKEDFLTKVALILLSERYNLFPEAKNYSNLGELSEDSCSLIYNDSGKQGQLDLSEDFFETYEMPLINAFWIVRNEEEPLKLKEFIEKCYDKEINDEFSIKEIRDSEIIREGSIITKWSSEIQNALEQIYQLLYLRHFIDEIPAVKLME
ncbi:MAG TPA: hypothetical protein PLE30_03470 [Candidatus Kapabacteria bacterium]|nr:hypothetical protein [Candidatus Kapabacteria bacterium]